MFNPWFAPLMFSSASTIALRTLMMVPEGGKLSPWQQREAARMVDEKLAAVRESHALAVGLAVQAWMMPWLFWGPLGKAPLRRMGEGTATVIAPFARRAEGNARRLGARAVLMPVAAPALAAVRAATAAGLPMAKVIPLFEAAPAARRRRHRK
jgi:hypothetical protein